MHNPPDIDGLRIPPHSIQAEQSLLGGILIDSKAWDRVADRIAASDFYRREHRIIFAALNDLAASHGPLDAITVSEHLERSGTLQEVGTLSYVCQLAKDTVSSANVVRYAEIIRERAMLRELIAIGAEVQDAVFEQNGTSAAEILESAQRRIFEVGADASAAGTGPALAKTHLNTFVEAVEVAYESGDSITGLPTGFVDLDAKTNGLQAGDLIVLAGRPSMGKTALGMNIAEHVAIAQKKLVLVFSLEMPGEQITGRMCASEGRLDFQALRTGKLDDSGWRRLTGAVSAVSRSRLFIDDTAGLSPMQMQARARRLSRKQGGVALVVVDYLQLMRVPGIRADNKVAEVTEISRSLKSLAKELRVPVLALSQLNREVDKRNDKHPRMSDLRDSGTIEQDADVILFIYRDEIYHPDTGRNGIAELAIAKQRNGPVGTVYLTAALDRMRFESFAGELPDARPRAQLSGVNGAKRFEY